MKNQHFRHKKGVLYMKKIQEKWDLYLIKKPRQVILFAIILLNILILIVTSSVLKFLLSRTMGDISYLDTIYYSICMMIDPGAIEAVVGDVTTQSRVVAGICLFVVIIGMITFTGAVIGYVTNYISGFIENANSNSRPLRVSNHTIILNWNSRAVEIINDMLYLNRKEVIVILVDSDSEKIKSEIDERIYQTTMLEPDVKNRLEIIVREGNTYSTKQLNDISVMQAKAVIILNRDSVNGECKFEAREVREKLQHGNANTIKTLVQVAEVTSSDESMDNQKIIVEVEDAWTEFVVNKIISHKERVAKCNIVSVSINKILGQLFSQFCIFPELNMVYSELFSNKGAAFFSLPENEVKTEGQSETEFVEAYLQKNSDTIPLTFMDAKSGPQFYYMGTDPEISGSRKASEMPQADEVQVNKKYWLRNRNVIILGHNSNVEDIMNGFDAFRGEWNRGDGSEILNVIVIDDKRSLERHGYYKKYPYVGKCIEAEVYDSEKITSEITQFIDGNEEDTSILILSDDSVPAEDIDSVALTNLIYVQDIIFEHVKQNPDYDIGRIDVIVEILNPKNYDVVHNYNINNIVISNRYISKMITQIGEKIELFELYRDILTYDTEQASSENAYESKEMYAKTVDCFLEKYPQITTADRLIRSVYEATPEDNKAILLGVVHKDGEVDLFEGNQEDHVVSLSGKDKLIVFSNH